MFDLVAQSAHLINCSLQTLFLTLQTLSLTYLNGFFWMKPFVLRAFNKSALISVVCGVCFFQQHLEFRDSPRHLSSVSKEERWRGVGCIGQGGPGGRLVLIITV